MNVYTSAVLQTCLAAIICNRTDLDAADDRIRSYFEFNDALLSGEYDDDHAGYKVAFGIVNNMDLNQYENFKTGYKLAIEKYGLEEGIERIKDKLISVLMATGFYESEKQLLSTLRTSYVQADLMARGGIHIDGGDSNV